MTSETPAKTSRARDLLLPALHVAVLSSFAVAQPLFDLLGRNSTFFVAHRAGPAELLQFTVGAMLVPTALALAVPAALAFVSLARARDALHLVVGVLFALLVVPPLARATHMRTLVAVALMGALTIAGALAYRRAGAVRRFLTLAGPAPLVFAGLFLLASPVRQVLFPNDAVVVASAGPGRGSPIVFLLLDEFAGVSIMNSDGTLDRDAFPNLGRLAETSTWYPNATGVHYATDRAVPAIVTGVLPATPKLANYAAHPRTLFTLLGGAYEMNAYESVTQLCPPRLCSRTTSAPERGVLARDIRIIAMHLLLPPRAADRWLGPLGDRWAGFGTQDDARARPARGPSGAKSALRNVQAYNERVEYFEQFIPKIEARRGPVLWFLHTLMPHEPWRYLPNGQRYERDAKRRLPGWKSGPWGSDPYLSRQGLQRYMLQAQLTDSLIGRLMDRMKRVGVFDDAIFVVLADHGVAFHPDNPRRGVTAVNKEQVVPVPLFVKLPGQRRGHVDHRNAQTIDVLPTIAAALGIEMPWPVDGRPLNRPDAKVPRKFFGGQDGVLHLPARMPGLRRASAEMRTWFGGDFRNLYRFGPHPDLLRRNVADLRVGTNAPGAVSLEFPELYRSVNRRGDFLPARFTGSTTRALRPGTPIAVALNGTIAGMGRIYGHPAAPQISVMLEPRWFVDGRNTITVFTVDDAKTLHPVALKNA